MVSVGGDKFAAQIRAFAEKTGQTLEDTDRGFKLGLFGRVVRLTRVADPLSWKRPDPSYVGGTMRGNWFVSTGSPVTQFVEGRLNRSSALPSDQIGRIQPFSVTYLSNSTPYVRVYEELDGMVSRAVADARRALERALADAKN